MFFTHHWEMSGPCPPLLQINQIHYATGWEGGDVWDDWSSNEQGSYLLLNEVEKQQMKWGFTSRGFTRAVAVSYVGLTTCRQHISTHTWRRNLPPSSLNCSQWGFFHTGADTKSWNIKRCPDSVVWVSIILALMALSLNHGEEANCQLLCPHYPRPPAQTGALGHCPRNHSAPVASQES